jgi:TonB family protein
VCANDAGTCFLNISAGHAGKSVSFTRTLQSGRALTARLGARFCARRRLARVVARALFALATSVPATLLAAQDFDQPGRPPAEAPPAAAPVLTRPPAVKKSVDPTYPPDALQEKLSADVTMQLDLDEEGHVSNAVVTKPAGHGFDEAATAAASEMEFTPAEIDGKPGKIRIEYVMHFVPNVAPPPAEPPPADAPPPAPPAPEPPPPPQPVIVRGRIREKGTRTPLGGADVAVIRNAPGAPEAANGRAEIVAASDEQGNFEVRGPAPGGLRIIVSDTDHEPCIRDFTAAQLGGSVVPQRSCYAAPRKGGFETRVRGKRVAEEVTRHTLSQAELTTVPGTFGDPLRVIQNLPGVARTPFGLGQLIVRGSAPQDSSVFVDGQKVPILYHFLGGPSVLTPNLIDKIDFYPGGFGAHYGRASAGVLDVTTKSDPLKELHGNADINLVDASGYVEGPLGGGVSGGVAARRSYVDQLLPLVIPQKSGSSSFVTTPVYWDYQARLSKELGPAGRLTLTVFGSDDTLHVLSQDPARGDLDLGNHIGFHRAVASWTVTKDGWVSRLAPSYGYDLFKFNAGAVNVDSSANVFALREDLSKTVNDHLSVIVGYDGQLRLDRTNFHIPIPAIARTFGRTAPEIADITRSLNNLGNAVYGEAIVDAGHGVHIVPGLRLDWFHYNLTDKYSADPRLTVRWEQTKTMTWKIGAGIYHQPQEAQILDPNYGNPYLKLIWAEQYHLGFEKRFSDSITLDTTVYFTRRHNLPVSDPATNFNDSGKGRGYGLELLLRHEITRHFFGWISYTLSRSEQNAASLGMPQSGPNGGIAATQALGTTYFPTTYDQTHNLILVGSYTYGNWEFGTRFRLVTGVPQTPVVGSIYDSDYDIYRPVEGPTNSTRRQTFHQLDLRVEHTWRFDAWRFSTYLDIQNVYNAANPELTQYDYRYQQSAPVRGIPFLPVLGIKGKF